jgi:hypothetical protein
MVSAPGPGSGRPRHSPPVRVCALQRNASSAIALASNQVRACLERKR